jgi:FkbM family methyltransferase
MSLLFRLQKKVKRYLFNLSAAENKAYLAYYKYLYKPGKGTVAEFIDNYSKSKSPVTFLQIGANDGFIYDPIHKFIKRDNWRGIMLEPQPEVFNQFLIRLHSKRPEITVINAALDVIDGTKTLYLPAISNERWATGLASFNREVLVNKIKDGTLKRQALKQGITLPEDENELIASREIETISPDTLLARFGDEKIDLLAVDTEGFDYEIIKMLDLSRIKPDIILYEEVNFDPATAAECRAYLERHGYSYRVISKDVLAIRD